MLTQDQKVTIVLHIEENHPLGELCNGALVNNQALAREVSMFGQWCRANSQKAHNYVAPPDPDTPEIRIKAVQREIRRLKRQLDTAINWQKYLETKGEDPTPAIEKARKLRRELGSKKGSRTRLEKKLAQAS